MLQSLSVTDLDILTPEQVETAYQIKRGTQAAMRSRGQIPYLKLGGRLVRYRRSEIESWLAARAIAATPPVPRARRQLSPETLSKRKATRDANRAKRQAEATP